MKEYKVINWKMGLTKNNERLEDTLNEHARSGWRVIDVAPQGARIILERDKNRQVVSKELLTSSILL